MNKKEFLAEWQKLEKEYDEICKNLRDITKKMEDNICDEYVFTKCLNEIHCINKKMDENRENLSSILKNYLGENFL